MARHVWGDWRGEEALAALDDGIDLYVDKDDSQPLSHHIGGRAHWGSFRGSFYWGGRGHRDQWAVRSVGGEISGR